MPYQYQMKHAPKRTQKPLRATEKQKWYKVPPTPKNTLKTQNRAIYSDDLLSPKQYQQNLAFLQEFGKQVEKITQNILANQLKALKTKVKPNLATFEKLRDNEPLFFGKDQWQQDKGKGFGE